MADELKLKHSDIKARCKICFWEGTILDLDHYKDDKTESYWICPGCVGEPEPSGIVFVINNHRPREQELEKRVAVLEKEFAVYKMAFRSAAKAHRTMCRARAACGCYAGKSKLCVIGNCTNKKILKLAEKKYAELEQGKGK